MGSTLDPLIEGVPLKQQDGHKTLRRTLSEKLADLEAAERAHLEDIRVNATDIWLPCDLLDSKLQLPSHDSWSNPLHGLANAASNRSA